MSTPPRFNEQGTTESRKNIGVLFWILVLAFTRRVVLTPIAHPSPLLSNTHYLIIIKKLIDILIIGIVGEICFLIRDALGIDIRKLVV